MLVRAYACDLELLGLLCILAHLSTLSFEFLDNGVHGRHQLRQTPFDLLSILRVLILFVFVRVRTRQRG